MKKKIFAMTLVAGMMILLASSGFAQRFDDDGQPASRNPSDGPVGQYQELGKGEPDLRVGQAGRGQGGPDTFGYTWIDSDQGGGPTYSWVEINTLGTALAASDDWNSANVPLTLNLGFTFSYYGTDFTSVNVCSNGWVSFNSSSTTYSNTTIPSSGDPNNLLALFWDDLNPSSGGTIYYYADTGNSRFIVEFDGVYRYGTSDPQTFQVIINSDGTLLYQYNTVSGTLTSCTVGIENGAGDDGLQVVYNASYLHNSLAILFSPPIAGWSGTDSYGYTGADSNVAGGPTYSWVEINTLGTSLAAGDDWNSANVPLTLNLGFTFNYYGTDFTSVNVCSNGWLSFNSTSTTYSNVDIPSSGDPNNLLAPLWDDLNPSSGGTIYYYADAANSRFIVVY